MRFLGTHGAHPGHLFWRHWIILRLTDGAKLGMPAMRSDDVIGERGGMV